MSKKPEWHFCWIPKEIWHLIVCFQESDPFCSWPITMRNGPEKNFFSSFWSFSSSRFWVSRVSRVYKGSSHRKPKIGLTCFKHLNSTSAKGVFASFGLKLRPWKVWLDFGSRWTHPVLSCLSFTEISCVRNCAMGFDHISCQNSLKICHSQTFSQRYWDGTTCLKLPWKRGVW